MIRANFSDSGASIGQDNVNMTYLHGLGDFFSMMFEDTSVSNLLLEGSTLVASEVYSRFLQLTSTLSLKDIQTATGSQVELLLLNSTDLVGGTLTEYVLPKSFLSARYIANRPLAPTELLETSVDFSITDSGTVVFARPIESYAISSRLLPDGSTKQYALWMVDAHLDEQLVSTYFGNLIGLVPESSTERFANLVYGLYYVYTQGPTLDILRKGMNVVLGIPLARMNETVLDIRAYLQTDQYLVITDQNQYLVPYGLPPSVTVGSTLSIGDELAKWVEVKDYINDGDWWLNLYIPRSLVPTLPPGEDARYATAGSSMDYIMRNYLKTHSFLVNVNVGAFKNTQQFTELFSIIKRAKPSYTQPIYVWSVDQTEDFLLDDSLTIGLSNDSEEDVGGGYEHMTRGSQHALLRGVSRYIRFNAPKSIKPLLGQSAYQNSSSNTLQGDTLSGYSNSISNFRKSTEHESSWIGNIANRGSDTWRSLRSQVGFRRNIVVANTSGVTVSTPQYGWSRLCDVFAIVPEPTRVVPLTVITQSELELKCGLLGIDAPARFESSFILGKLNTGYEIDATAINSRQISGVGIRTLYPSMFRRDSTLPQSRDMNREMLREFMPDVNTLTASDIIVGFRISCDVVSLNLISYNNLLEAPSVFDVDDSMDALRVEIDAQPTRGMAGHGSPFYLSRGNGSTYSPTDSVNNHAVADSPALPQNEFLYRDMYNASMPVNRGGMRINHVIEA